jgi:hypothetical protein
MCQNQGQKMNFPPSQPSSSSTKYSSEASTKIQNISNPVKVPSTNQNLRFIYENRCIRCQQILPTQRRNFVACVSLENNIKTHRKEMKASEYLISKKNFMARGKFVLLRKGNEEGEGSKR